MSSAIDLLSWAALAGGSALILIAGFGLLRLPDFFSRVHAVGIMDTLGAGLIIGGLLLQGGLSLVAVKLVLILMFLLITGPTATHALARAALHGDQRPVIDHPQESRPSNN